VERERATGGRKARIALILGGLSAFGPLSIDMYLPSLPGLTRDLGTVPSEAQLTLSACMIGLAAGQLVAGPLSDSLGRRTPLLVGLLGYVGSSALCAVVPSVQALIVVRLVQGAAGGAGIVIARAVVRDLYEGAEMSRFFSLLMLIMGVAPIVAPIAGAQLLRVTSWRGIFLVLAAIGAALLVASAAGLSETLPSHLRRRGGLPGMLRSFRDLLRHRVVVGYVLSGSLGFGAMFAYIAGSPFVLENVYRLSPQLFSAVFAANALGLVLASQVSRQLAGRVGLRTLLTAGLVAGLAGGAGLLGVVASGLGLGGVLLALFVTVASVGVTAPNAVSLALDGYPRMAGLVSSLYGLLQSLVGAAAAPLVGMAGTGTALPMAAVMAAFGCAALLAYALLAAPPARPRPVGV
jgi:DHA1 family bicyclomycin/chloramphenicol resistance-like MFS transporter